MVMSNDVEPEHTVGARFIDVAECLQKATKKYTQEHVTVTHQSTVSSEHHYHLTHQSIGMSLLLVGV
jgi:hypothetical protein